MGRTSQRSAALKNGWRSGLEEALGEQLKSAGTPYEYEKLVVQYEQPAKMRKYTPDYVLLDNGIVVESKGRFVSADRQKHLLVQKQFKALDLRFVFSNPNQRISKQSKTTYAMWCESHGFKYAKQRIPEAWLQEPPNAASLALIRKLKGKP